MLVLSVVINTVNNSNLGSTLSSGTKSMSKEFGITSKLVLVLPGSMYLLGYVFGPMITAPMSEFHGRKMVLLGSFTVYTIATLACGLAPNMMALIIFRFIMGLGAATPLSVIGGTAADLFPDPIDRGRAIGFFVTAAGFGQAIGAILAGYLSVQSWSLPYFAALTIALASLVLCALNPETFQPILLKNRAKRMRLVNGERVFAPIELKGRKSVQEVAREQLGVPFRMLFKEILVSFSSLYLALVYGIYYLFFQAYHKVYEDGFKLSSGEAGLTFIAAGLGGVIAFGIQWIFERRIRRIEKWGGTMRIQNKDDRRRLPLACLAGPFFILSMFWTGTTASHPQSAPVMVTVLAVVPFGIGYNLIFISLSNYLIDSYEVYAASAMAATSASRSLLAAGLPLCTEALYGGLGIQWGFYLLGFVMIGLSVVPFAFLKFGPRLRKRSDLFQELRRKAEAESAS
ncbi:MFS general substrate transporter [Tothia fuscella]|uniref:MFS general substrate transporter n=1 Tax=Tothia fuscella TaxID=1048955 RepID=A0A9P4NE72_9PEZI|nr:MFS general substrate transporter [Tothia fuscella]